LADGHKDKLGRGRFLVMQIESIQTGQPRTVGKEDAEDPLQRAWTSAIWKEPVHGPVWAAAEGLNGDAHVSTKSHGGPERALLLYAAEHYPRWRAEWSTRDVGPGAFGENLTVSGLDEAKVCVGDLFAIGDVRIEVSGPREPCMTLVRRHGRKDLMEVINGNHRTGWYARVQREGWLEAGLPLDLLDRPYPQWPIVRAALVRRNRTRHPDEARLLAACPALITDWRAKLGR